MHRPLAPAPVRATLPLLLLVSLIPLACSDEPGSPGGEPPASPDAPPSFQVDPTWPRELPNDWILGSITSVFVDDRDHV